MWQAGLLCLLTTAQAVLVHQSPVYAKLQPQTTYSQTPVTYSQPQPAYNQHQSLFSQPQPAYNQPQPLFSQPQPAYNQPQQLFSQPQPAYNQPQQLFSQPQPAYNQPQPLFSQPQPVYNQPQPLLTHPKPLLSHSQPALSHLQPVSNHLQPSSQKEDYYDEPSYSFAYQIHDDLTGDQKSHTETRQGDMVQGSYSLIEPDGSRRIVDYVADKIGGFRAQVRREKGAAKPIVAAAKPIVAVAKPPVAVYQPTQSYVPRYTQVPKYQNGLVSFTPAKYLYSQQQPAPVTEQKYTTATVKPLAPYNPVVYASPAEDKARTAPGSFTNPNQISYKPVQYA